MASLDDRIASVGIAISEVDAKLIVADEHVTSFFTVLQTATAAEKPELMKYFDHWSKTSLHLREEKLFLQKRKSGLQLLEERSSVHSNNSGMSAVLLPCTYRTLLPFSNSPAMP